MPIALQEATFSRKPFLTSPHTFIAAFYFLMWLFSWFIIKDYIGDYFIRKAVYGSATVSWLTLYSHQPQRLNR